MSTQSIRSLAARCFALAVFAFGGAAFAQQQQAAPADPPARVGTVSVVEGSVVFAPAGETEWANLPRNRPVTKGDRLWTDEGARAELHFGSSVLHMASRTFVEVMAVDDDVVQLAVNEGTVNARVRELRAGDNFEITTPQLALRATQPGDWRIDVDPGQGLTRVASHGGVAVLYGAGGNVQQVTSGQQVAFTGRDLTQVGAPPLQFGDFERWAADRNRAEDQSIASRYIPREVVGYQELDQNGTWAQDPTYGPVWYPQVTAADWAPYRYGRWEWIAPWGWTWIDDAPWGFAPFHYGRWAMVGSRWCWVPGPLGRHPVYAPALVAFVGGTGGNLTVSSGPGIGWYPLAPGEIWQPFVDASPVYARNVNRYLVTDSRYFNTGPHRFMRRPDAITTVRIDDFNRGRPVHQRWARVAPADIARVQPMLPPVPLREARREHAPTHVQAPPVQRFAQPAPATPAQGGYRAQPPQQVQPQPRGQQQFQPRDVAPRPQPFWRPGEEGGWSRLMREQPQVQQAALQQQREQAVRQQQAVQQQQHEQAMHQQQAAREAQRQQAWQAQQHQQHAWAAQQQRAAAVQQQHAWAAQQQRVVPAQAQRAHERHDERAVQRQAQRSDDPGHGHGRHYQ
jgi:hypothetical protein